MAQAECEYDWILGQPGVYNASSENCICPTGYSGKDDWKEFHSCHVDDRFSDTLKLGLVITCIVQILISALCLAWVTKKWDFNVLEGSVRNISKTISSKVSITLPARSNSYYTSRANSKSSFSSDPRKLSATPRGFVDFDSIAVSEVETLDDQSNVDNQSNATHNRRNSKFQFFRKPELPGECSDMHRDNFKREWRRKKSAIIALQFSIAYGVTLCLYIGFQTFGAIPWRRFDGKLYEQIILNVCLAVASSLLMSAYYALLVSLYNTLPSVSRYGALLKMTSIFVRFPYLVFRLSKVAVGLTIIASLIFLVLLPSIDPEFRLMGDRLWLGTMMTLFAIFVAQMSLVVQNVRKIFSAMIEHLQNSDRFEEVNETELKNYKKGLRTANGFLLVGWIISFPALAVFGLMIGTDLRYTYILIHVIGYLSIIVCMFVSSLMVFTDGGLSLSIVADRN